MAGQRIQAFLSRFSSGQQDTKTKGGPQKLARETVNKKEKIKTRLPLGGEGGPLYKKRKCYVCFIINSSANCLFFFLLFSFYKEIKSLNIGKMKNSSLYNLIWFVCFLVFAFCFVLSCVMLYIFMYQI